MEVRPIRTDKDHKAALAQIATCWGAPEGSDEGDKLDVLLALVEIYEAKRWPIDVAPPSLICWLAEHMLCSKQCRPWSATYSPENRAP